MGLTIYYRWKIKADANAARSLVHKLHARVSKLPFDQVTEVTEFNPPDGKYAFLRLRARIQNLRLSRVALCRKSHQKRQEFQEILGAPECFAARSGSSVYLRDRLEAVEFFSARLTEWLRCPSHDR